MFRTVLSTGRVASRAFQLTRCSPLCTRYSPSHEYVKIEGDIGTVGITQFAADALGDIVFVDLPSIGTKFSAGESFGSVESVKAASDVYSPVAGEVVEVNAVRTSLTITYNPLHVRVFAFINCILKMNRKVKDRSLICPLNLLALRDCNDYVEQKTQHATLIISLLLLTQPI